MATGTCCVLHPLWAIAYGIGWQGRVVKWASPDRSSALDGWGLGFRWRSTTSPAHSKFLLSPSGKDLPHLSHSPPLHLPSPRSTLRVGKSVCSLAPLIGAPFGSVFELQLRPLAEPGAQAGGGAGHGSGRASSGRLKPRLVRLEAQAAAAATARAGTSERASRIECIPKSWRGSAGDVWERGEAGSGVAPGGGVWRSCVCARAWCIGFQTTDPSVKALQPLYAEVTTRCGASEFGVCACGQQGRGRLMADARHRQEARAVHGCEGWPPVAWQ